MTKTAWAAMWRAKNKIDGKQRMLLLQHGVVKLFATRGFCLNWIEENYSYIRHRPELRREPYGWMMPVPVSVAIVPLRKAKVTP